MESVYKNENDERRSLFVTQRLNNSISVDTIHGQKKKIENTHTIEQTSTDCNMCQSVFDNDEIVCGLSCGHIFHPNCQRKTFHLGVNECEQTCPECENYIQLENSNQKLYIHNNLKPNETIDQLSNNDNSHENDSFENSENINADMNTDDEGNN